MPCTPRSANRRWSWIFCPTRSGATAARAESDDQSRTRACRHDTSEAPRAVSGLGVLHAGARGRDRARTHAPARRAPSRAALCRESDAARSPPRRGRRHRARTRTHADAAHRHHRHLPTAQDDATAPGASRLPVPPPHAHGDAAESRVGGRYHVHPDGTRLCLPRRGDGLGESEGPQLAALADAHRRLLCRRARGSARPLRHTRDRQHLSLIHISEPTRLLSISYAVFCLKKKKNFFFFFLMIRRPPRSTLDRSSAASDVYKRQLEEALARFGTPAIVN